MSGSISAAVTRLHILNSTARLQPKETAEPIATSVSIFGAPCSREPKPLVKNFLFIHITTRASSIWIRARVM